ncbi:MAG: hypothetical protein ABR909_10875 [Candidatus Bathyarchaeia archaeon]
MTKESEVEKTARFVRHLIIGIILVVIIVVGSIIGIGAYWAWHQEQIVKNIVTSLTPTATPNYISIPTPTPEITPTTYTIFLSPYYGVLNGGTVFRVGLNCGTNSPVDITISSANILYNGGVR